MTRSIGKFKKTTIKWYIYLMLPVLFLNNLYGTDKNLAPIYANGILIVIPGDNSLSTNKYTYFEDEIIVVDYALREHDVESWIGIFRKGDAKNSYNIIEDLGTDGVQKGRLVFYGLDSGKYDIVLYGKTLEPKYPLVTRHIVVEKL